jgi:hypothetical protein
MSDVQLFATLPQLALSLGPLEGRNLDPRALLLRSGFRSVEDAIFKFRTQHAAEKLPFFRRYYLKPGKKPGTVAVWYVWHIKKAKTDEFVGTVRDGDEAMMRVLIGNHVAGCFMTPIKWVLCEDRNGEEPISMGRFDPWSLLINVSEEDLERSKAFGLVINPDLWDFDDMYFRRVCPGCGNAVSINFHAFNIDSARCSTCGLRPFLSESISRFLQHCLPGVTMGDPDENLGHVIGWMGEVGAKASELHQEGLPAEWTPQRVIADLLSRSQMLKLGDDPATSVLPEVIRTNLLDGVNGGAYLQIAEHAARLLARKIAAGEAFDSMDASLMDMLFAAARGKK